MKKLALFFAAVVLTAISWNVFGQDGSGVLPTIGTNHEYYVNSSDGSSHESGVGNNYHWWVSTNVSDLTDSITSGTDFTVVNGKYSDNGAVNNYKIELRWNAPSNGTTYYLVVQETDVDGNLCSNLKAIAIQPQNIFEITYIALGEDGTTPGDSLSRCPSDIALTASGLDITYDYGVDTLLFQLNATGIYSGWSFASTTDTTTIGNSTGVIEFQIGTGAWKVLAANPETISVPSNPAGSEIVKVRVALDNGDTSGTYEEGAGVDGEQTIKLTLSNVEGSGGLTPTITNNSGTDITAEPVQLHTIKARPATTGIGTDN